MPCTIYMHGNASNKFEGEQYASDLLPLGINLFTFDFSGCGNSEGEWITLGYKERDDLETVLAYLKQEGTTSKVAFWGRSMGAATAIMYMQQNKEAAVCAVLDSSFSTF